MNWKPLLQNKWLIVLGVLGVMLIAFGTLGGGAAKTMATLAQSSSATPSSTDANTGSAISSTTDGTVQLQNSYEKELTTMLDQVQGVHQVNVMVTLDSTGAVQVANNQQSTTQSQSNGRQVLSSSSTQDTQVFTERTSSGSQVPYVVKQYAPTVRGVFVTVSADDFYVAKAEIIDAIQHVLDVPAYKISVEPKKNNS